MSMLPSEAAKFYWEQGYHPIPIPPDGGRRTKAPKIFSWQARAFYTETEVRDFPAIFPPGYNIGIQTGPKSGNLIDIDLDQPEAVDFAKAYLPETGMRHGRPSNPLCHYWYRTPTTVKYIKNIIPETTDTLIELRSSSDRGLQTIVPPSVHPDTNEVLEWMPSYNGMPGEPAVVDGEVITSIVAIISAGATLAKHFPKHGSRHEFALALAGLLLRGGVSENEAHKFIYEVCRVGGSNNPQARAAVVRSTAEKVRSGGEITGFPRLSQIVGVHAGNEEKGVKVLQKVCKWLDLKDVRIQQVVSGVERIWVNAQGTKQNVENKGSAFGDSTASFVPLTTTETQSSTTLTFDDLAWRGTLKEAKQGGYAATGYNIHTILSNSEKTKGCFRFDDVAKEIVATGIFGKYDSEVLAIHVANWLSSADYSLDAREGEVGRQILAIALENHFDPIVDYLRSLEWDGVSRISEEGGWLTRYARAETPKELGAEKYVEFVGRKWLVSMVARALDPGCKADLVLILEGLQGRKKSTLFEILAGKKWFCDLAIAVGDKDSKMMTSGFWLAELPDLAALKNARDQNMVKAFFSAAQDKFRPPYGKTVKSAPRRIVFGGTTNDYAYLADDTGNRRYCCVYVNRKIDIAALIRDRDQLFAEAVFLYNKHVNECEDKLECCCWWFTEEEIIIQERENVKRAVESPEREIIMDWWYAMKPDDRPRRVTTSQIAQEAFGAEKDRIDTGKAMKYGAALRKLGFKRDEHGLVNGHWSWFYVAPEEMLKALQVERRRTAGPKIFALAGGGK